MGGLGYYFIFKGVFYMHNFSYVFKKEAFDLDFFKIYLEERKYNTYLFVSDRFKKIMEENNVTSLALEKVYSI